MDFPFINDLITQLLPKPAQKYVQGLKKIASKFKSTQELYDLLKNGSLTEFKDAINEITKGGPNS